MSMPIDNEGAYKAKIRSCTETPTALHRCPACGVMCGKAVNKAGKEYLASVRIEEDRDGTPLAYYARKGDPHFVTCTKTPAPGVLAKGSMVVVVKGRNVPIGVRGTAFWFGPGDYGERIGIKDADGKAWFTAVSNVLPIMPGTETVVVK